MKSNEKRIIFSITSAKLDRHMGKYENGFLSNIIHKNHFQVDCRSKGESQNYKAFGRSHTRKSS